MIEVEELYISPEGKFFWSKPESPEFFTEVGSGATFHKDHLPKLSILLIRQDKWAIYEGDSIMLLRGTVSLISDPSSDYPFEM